MRMPALVHDDRPAFLLVGPYDPHCGEYTFLAPPLGVWRLQGVLTEAGYDAAVFDPNLTDGPPEPALDALLRSRRWDVVGISTTGMTLRFDLALAHRVRRALPDALIVAGGMEATFRPELMFELGPFDLVVLGEGELPLLALGERLMERASTAAADIVGTAWLAPDGTVARRSQRAMSVTELTESIFATPYERMPYRDYWARLERAYRVDALPEKAAREARWAETRAVRLNTLNYCPMNCSFCSSTNFLHAAQGSIAKVGRLSAEDCLRMIRRIVSAFPDTRTVIFQDDIFVFTSDDRILPLCEGIVEDKRTGRLPEQLQFISTNRIDAMTEERLRAMRGAGFRVLGFGVESFSLEVLREFNKARIHPFVEPHLRCALDLGLRPFLDLILTSPRCSLESFAETVRSAFRWLEAGCEIGAYPYVIPFSGAAMAEDPRLREHTVSVRHRIADTDLEWDQPSKILPVDPEVRSAILETEERFERLLERQLESSAHVPSRVRSLLWIASAIAPLRRRGCETPDPSTVELRIRRLPEHTSAGESRVGAGQRPSPFLEPNLATACD